MKFDFSSLREKYGVSIGDLNRITGIPKSTLIKWEYKDRKMPPYTYFLLEYFLKNREKDEILPQEEKGDNR